MWYSAGQRAALADLGLIKEAAPAPLLIRARKNPFIEFHRRIDRAFRIKTPKFDMSALMKRLFRNPLKQPRLQLGGKTPVLKA